MSSDINIYPNTKKEWTFTNIDEYLKFTKNLYVKFNTKKSKDSKWHPALSDIIIKNLTDKCTIDDIIIWEYKISSDMRDALNEIIPYKNHTLNNNENNIEIYTKIYPNKFFDKMDKNVKDLFKDIDKKYEINITVEFEDPKYLILGSNKEEEESFKCYYTGSIFV